MKAKKIVAAALLAALALSLCACGQREKAPTDAVSVWFLESEPFAGQLAELSEAYNRKLSREQLPVSLRSFPDEAALAGAFDAARPDLLLCSHERAFALYEAGVLTDAASYLGPAVPAYPEALGLYSACIGRSFFPLGFDTQLLLTGPGTEAETDLEVLLTKARDYGEESGLPYLTADSFADLLYGMLLSKGKELHGLRRLDISEPDYRAAYNLLAEAAYTGGLASYEAPAADLLKAGLLPCAAARSSTLTELKGSGLNVFPLPRLESGSVYLAQGVGLAVTVREGRSPRPAAAFLAWLCDPERLAGSALSGGLVPAAGCDGMEETDALSGVLLELAREGESHLPEPGADYPANREALEAELRSAVELLN